MKRKQADTVEGSAKRVKVPADSVPHGTSAESGDPLYRAPTGDEITSIRETTGLFRSNLFRMQISELLSEVRTESRYKSLDKALREIKEHLENLPEVNTFELNNEPAWMPVDTKLPVAKELLGQCTSGATFSFSAPSSIKVVGSYLLGTMSKPDLNVDMSAQIPASCLDSGDHLNHRYTHKRAAYLCYLASELAHCSAVAKVDFICQDSRLMPILAITPAGKAGNRFTIRVHPVIAEDAFKPVRLGPTRNCLRWAKFFDGDAIADEPATPHYNNLLLRDMAMYRHLALLHSTFEQCQAMPDAIRLFKVWLRQRSMAKDARGFNGFLASMLAVHLLRTRQLAPTMSSYQILRMILKTLATSNWTKRGVFMHRGDDTPSPEEFHKAFEVVFIDDTGYVNLTAHMSEASYRDLVHEAKLAMRSLDLNTADAFEALFVTPVKFTHKFDQILQIARVKSLRRKDNKAWQTRCLSHGGDWLAAGERYLGRVLRRGLGSRATLVVSRCKHKDQWHVSKGAPHLENSTISVGILLDPAKAYTIVEQGPSADAAEAEDFRAFWGKKSELRRFQDSSILEAVVWPAKTAAERRTIPARVSSHVLQRHLDIPAGAIVDSIRPYDGVLQPLPLVKAVPKAGLASKRRWAFAGTGEEECSKIMTTFDLLTKQLRGMEELSLDIVSVRGASPLFRHTEVFPSSTALRCHGAKSLSVAHAHGQSTANWRSSVLLPSTAKCPPWTDIFDVVCHLEGSGQWPDDLDAIARVKASFYLQLSSMLEQKHSVTAVPTPFYLYICLNGFVFRLTIAHAHELTLIERHIVSAADESQASAVATPSASTASASTPGLTDLQRHTVALPLHTGHIHSVSQQFPAYSMACRLAKRWVSSHLLSRFFSDEAVELLVAHVFLHATSFQPPGSGIAGLLRFLTLIAEYSWATQPLFLNLGAKFSSDDMEQLTSTFKSRREHLPAIVVYTPSDRTSRWTSPQPKLLALRRCQTLAKQAMKVLEGQLLSPLLTNDYQLTFRPSLDDYHVLIELRSRHVPHLFQSLSNTSDVEVNAEDIADGSLQLPVAGFDPASLYLDQLEAAYGHVALFFYDRFGGTMIGVVWTVRPSTTSPFKIAAVNASCPVTTTRAVKGKGKKASKAAAVPDGENCIAFNMPAALDDFRILGAGLVKHVHVQTELET